MKSVSAIIYYEDLPERISYNAVILTSHMDLWFCARNEISSKKKVVLAYMVRYETKNDAVY